MKIKAVLFARVSTREQAEEGYSLDSQEKLLKDYADKKDFILLKRFSVPESASGRQERKLFIGLLDYIYEHPEIKIVICEKVDRITRNLKDAVKLDDWLNEDSERQIHFVKQSLIIHKEAKSHEKFQWDIYLALARQYSNNLSEETKKGLFEKADQGWYPGSHKRGYKCIGEMGHKTWVIDEQNIDSIFIPKAFEYFNSGNYTLRTLTKQLFSEGWISSVGKPLANSELHKILTDPFFCGEFLWHNKLYIKARHKPLVSKELFNSVQDRMTRKIKAGKYRKHSFLFGNGLMECDNCGCSVTWETAKGHNYGHCTNFRGQCGGRKFMREEKVQEQILGFLDQIKIDNPRLLEWVRKALKEAHKDESDYHLTTLKDLDNRLNQIEKRLSIIYDDRVDGIITKELYEKKRIQYEMEAAELLEAKEKHVKADVDYRKLGINIFELSQKGREIYETKATQEEKREFLNFVFSNLKLSGEKVVPTFQNGFEVVALRAKSDNVQGWKESNPR